MPCENNSKRYTNTKKPPIGLTPKKFWNETVKISRLKDIEEAISRYTSGKYEIPVEWIEEYNEIIKQI